MESISPSLGQAVDLAGQVILITGANSGVGKATSLQLAKMGAHVVMLARDRQRGEKALDEVAAGSNNPNVHLMLCDLASLTDVSRFTDAFKDRFDRLDVLVNNAGIYLLRRHMSVDGLEKMMAVNHLAPFLLTNRLLDLLEKSAPARIVNVASVAHKGVCLDLEDMAQRKKYNFNRVYGETKLMNILFTYELARRLEGKGITVNALHPGFVRTNMARRENGWLVRMLAPLAFVFAVSPEEAAETPVYLASSPEVSDITGRYFYKKRAVRSSTVSHDEHLQKRLWETSERLAQEWWPSGSGQP